MLASHLSNSPHLSPGCLYTSSSSSVRTAETPPSSVDSSLRGDKERSEKEDKEDNKSKRENGVSIPQQEEQRGKSAVHQEKEGEHAKDRDDERKMREQKKGETGGYEDEEEDEEKNIKGKQDEDDEKGRGDNHNHENVSIVKMNGDGKSSRPPSSSSCHSLPNHHYCKSHEFVDDVRSRGRRKREVHMRCIDF